MTQWLWMSTDPVRLAAAAAIAVLYVLFCFAIRSGHRRKRARAIAARTAARRTDHSSLLVAFASQTGFAEQLAWQTAGALRAAGVDVAVEPLAQLQPHRLPAAARALFVVSTTGEGDPPDSAAGFARVLADETLRLPALRYGLLALGDREYRNFCGFGRRLEGWLKGRGAQPLFESVEVDNGDEQALRRWRERLSALTRDAATTVWQEPPYQPWRLKARHLANPHSAGQPAFYLTLEPPDAAGPVQWQPGDIAEIRPHHCVADVVRFLEAAGLDGREDVQSRGRTMKLAELLTRSVLPAQIPPGPPQAIADWLADSLAPLPQREYSIASLPADGVIDLLVRQSRDAAGRLGLASGWLTEHAWPNARIELRIRANTAFRPPPDNHPLILIGNGTGMAGLRPHLKARARVGTTRNWLIFGERNAVSDFYYRDELLAWQARGVLTRVDWAFSRDQPAKVYVQHVLLAARDDVRHWVDDGAYIYLCGSLEGMAPAVHAAFDKILGGAALARLTEAGRYRREVY